MAFKEIKIERFRGIRQCEIKDLAKRVNLFVGQNNCGKTSVLDALFLLCGIANHKILFRINHAFRSLKAENFKASIEINFHDLNLDKDIQLSSLGEQNFRRKLNIKTIFNNQNSAPILLGDATVSRENSNEIEQRISSLEYNFHVDGENYKSIAQFGIQENGEETIQLGIDKPYKENIRCRYLNTNTPFLTFIEDLASVIENKQTDVIVDTLKQIDPRIQNIAIVGDKIMVDLGGEKLLPIQIMGDGIRRILAIALSLFNTQDGILLIDEIDNGLHYKSMDTLWKTIFYAAEKFNVQVFATTHNIDSLKALKRTLESTEYEKEQENTKCFRLRRKDDDALLAFGYDFQQFEYAIETDQEIR